MSGDIIELPLAQVYPGPLVRSDRLDLDHVAVLRDVETLPPVIVRQTAKGYECLDGSHRCAARRTAGFETVRAVVREADDAEALELAYSLNKEHGLPLTLAERKAGARKLIAGTQLSDASIGSIVGLNRDTIANLRPGVQGAQNRDLDTRTGTDGKTYPSPAVARLQRERAEAAYAADPTLSIRKLMQEATCSKGIAESVIAAHKNEPEGTVPATPPAPPTGSVDDPSSADGDQRDDLGEVSPTAPGKHLGVVPPIADTAPTVGEVLDHCPVPGDWHKLPAMSSSNGAMAAAKFLDRRLPKTDDDPTALAARIPAAHRDEARFAAHLAREFWGQVEAVLSHPASLTTVEEA